jgi:hypothetical protein
MYFAYSCLFQGLSGHPQMDQRKLRHDLSRVLSQSSVACLLVSKLSLEDPQRMLDLCANARLETFDLIVYHFNGICLVQFYALARSHRDMTANRAGFSPLFEPLIAGIGIQIRFLSRPWNSARATVTS